MLHLCPLLSCVLTHGELLVLCPLLRAPKAYSTELAERKPLELFCSCFLLTGDCKAPFPCIQKGLKYWLCVVYMLSLLTLWSADQ